MSSYTASIESVATPGKYLRIDGRNVPATVTSPGSGVVDAQTFVGAWETLTIQEKPDGSISILSAFPNIYLRLDGTGVDQPNIPGGTVNCQWSAGILETFRLVTQEDGSKAIASVQFPGVFLSLDFNDGGDESGGHGTVSAVRKSEFDLNAPLTCRFHFDILS